MSWGYWGIVAGLGAMLAMFFLCMGILWSGEKGSSSRLIGEPEDSATADKAAVRARQAA
jgi:hypothetical protein